MPTRSEPRARWARLLALLLTLGLVAAACGGNDDEGGAAGGGPEDTLVGVEEDAGPPQDGGKVVYGLEADTGSPWTPQNAICAISCHMVMRSVFDTLALPDSDGEVVGNLLTAIEPNEDYTVWTLTVRDGITFHDGTPLDGAAVADNLNRHRQSILTGNALADVTDVTADGMTATVTSGRPWVKFPVFITGQIGYTASPTWLAAVDADPSLASQPVGTGPFVFESYSPGGAFVATKNPNYWREGLPHLDEIEYRVYESAQTRSRALESGEADIIHTSNGDEIAKFRENDQFRLIESSQYGETGYVLLNVGDDASPLSDVRVRRALAMATDNETLIQARTAGVFEQANGPYPPGTIGYLEDTGFPTYDPEGARALVEEYEAENGPIQIAYKTTTDEFNLVTAQLYQQFWNEVGIETTLDQIQQDEFILAALQGDFQAFGWRNHGGFDPDAQEFWWHSRNALPPGGLALNFGRISDEVIDEQLAVIRTNPDPEARREAAEAINRRFGEQVYNLWNWWTIWGIVTNPRVHNVVTGFELPDGGETLGTGVGIGGAHQVSQIWVDQ